MPITEAQRESRKKHLGGSDIPALLGLDPFKNAYDIWLEKTGKLDDMNEENDAMRAGRLFEDGLLLFASEELGPIIRNQYRSAPGLPIGSNIDAILADNPLPIEAKLTSAHSKEHWGNPWTDDVPDRVIAQCHAHMICMDKEKPQLCYHPHYDPWKGLGLYVIPRNEELVEIISQIATDFWQKHVLADDAPAGQPTMDVAARMKRKPEKLVQFDEEAVEYLQKYLAAKSARTKLEEMESRLKARVLSILGDAEGTEEIEGIGSVTYLEQSKSSVDVPGLRKDRPGVYDLYERTSTYRVLRVKKPAKKKAAKKKEQPATA